MNNDSVLFVNRIAHTLPDGSSLFKEVSFSVSRGECVALIGPNGSGKSTILRLITNRELPQEGAITQTKALAFLPQDIANLQISVGNALAKTLPETSRTLYERMLALESAPHSDAQAEEYGYAVSEWYELGGADSEAIWEQYCQEVLGSSFEDARSRILSTFSGGEVKRLLLSVLFAGSEELLILDEPDNFLDVEGKLWLQKMINDSKKAILLVSHDRVLLTQVADKVVTLEGQTAWIHFAGFETYYNGRQEYLNELIRHNEAIARRRERIEEDIAQLKRWAASSASRARQLVSARRRLEVVTSSAQEKALPTAETVSFRLPGGSSGKKVLTLRNVAVQPVLLPFSSEVRFGDRIAIIGPNGIGKSHLVRAICGQETRPIQGEVQLGARVIVGYFDQRGDTEKLLGKNPVDAFRERGIPNERIMPILARYGLASRRDVPFQFLSGGQQARLQLALMETSGANLLVLDEPTDNLDVISSEELEAALEMIQGTVIAVSHDRWFLQSCFKRFWRVNEGGKVEELSELPANYQF
jgi:ATPase subunit of ABC transporter with duplicated ATPase domains